MKRNLVFLVLLMFALYSFSNEIECYPDSEGNYLYYCNVKNKEVFSEFSKEDLQKQVEKEKIPEQFKNIDDLYELRKNKKAVECFRQRMYRWECEEK
jgi:hypothetical protein